MCKQKNCPRYFQICNHAFFNIWKGDKQKSVLGIFRFVSMLFLIFEKGNKQKKLIIMGIHALVI